MDKYENEIYEGKYPQASSDHHEDINKHNLKYADSEYHQWELEQQQQDEKGD
tara:strand:+ start:276 stop:431 length:156 start_codon:yes stop_codon:yes gene_type:complete